MLAYEIGTPSISIDDLADDDFDLF